MFPLVQLPSAGIDLAQLPYGQAQAAGPTLLLIWLKGLVLEDSFIFMFYEALWSSSPHPLMYSTLSNSCTFCSPFPSLPLCDAFTWKILEAILNWRELKYSCLYRNKNEALFLGHHIPDWKSIHAIHWAIMKMNNKKLTIYSIR